MTNKINWITKKVLSKETGMSVRAISYLMSKGDIDYKKTSESKQAGVLISISSFNKHFDSLKIA